TTDTPEATQKEVVNEVVVAVTPKPVKPRKKKLPETAWTIQLGAFQNAANINSLLKTLHKAGFQAHTVPTEVIDGKLTRLFVGPDVSKAKLEKQLPRLKRLTKLEGKLLPFDAVNP
ncbi:MAG: sporulation protein, partial [Psychromonas sp.]|nr:sporulation protein [Psychromonas sp.]